MSDVRFPRILSPTGLALLTAILCPLAFGAVGVLAWVPLSWLWILLGIWSFLQSRREPGRSQPGPLRPLTPTLLFIHGLLCLQLVPLPPAVLRVISPGSFAAQHVPPMVVETWTPLTASPIGTAQTWLFFAGVHGLAYAFLGTSTITRSRRLALLFAGMAAMGAFMAVEGLVQATSDHPFWLYSIFPVPGAGSHERGIFGPYYNRDHYSNLLAIAGAVCAGLLAKRLGKSPARLSFALVNTPDFASILALGAALLLMFTASAASGSRGGLAAIGIGVAVGLASPFLARPRLALGCAVLLAIVLFATGVPAAVSRMADTDFETSRLMVWRDTLRLIEFYPFFGCGLGAFAPAYWPYQRVVRFEYWPHAHNEYLQWVLEAGGLGILLALYWIRAIWRNAPRLIRNQEVRPALAGLVAALVHAAVECSLRIPANAAWAGVLLVCISTEAAIGRERVAPKT